MATKRRYAAFDDLMADDEDEQPLALLGAAYSLGLTPAKRKPQQQPAPAQPPPPRQSSGRAREGLGGRPVQSGDPIMFGTLINRGKPYESGLYYS